MGNPGRDNQIRLSVVFRLKLGEEHLSPLVVGLKGCDPESCSSLDFCEPSQCLSSEFSFIT